MIKKVNKLWGSEDWIVNNDRYCGKILNLKKGFQSSLHYHKNKNETFYLLEGQILMETEKEKKVMNPGDVQILPPLTKHRFTPLTDSKIIEFSTHHEDSDTYRDAESRKLSKEELNKLFMEYK